MQIGDNVEFHSWQDIAIGKTFCRKGIVQDVETFNEKIYLHITEEITDTLYIVDIGNTRVFQKQ